MATNRGVINREQVSEREKRKKNKPRDFKQINKSKKKKKKERDEKKEPILIFESARILITALAARPFPICLSRNEHFPLRVPLRLNSYK